MFENPASALRIEEQVLGSKEAHLRSSHARKAQCVSVVELMRDNCKGNDVAELCQVPAISCDLSLRNGT